MNRKSQSMGRIVIRLSATLILIAGVSPGWAESLLQKSPQLIAASGDAGKGSRDALFDDDEVEVKQDAGAALKPKEPAKETASPGLKGFLQLEMARTTGSKAHWSKLLTRADVGSQGTLGNGIKWKLGARMDYDAAYDRYNYYPHAVDRDQRFNLSLRENYIDFGAGNWDFRLGKQNVVWGEMVGLFFADVVSARNMHEFILPEFDAMRIPQWAARAEYFNDDFHAELLWIPVASYDQIGKPGAEFYPDQLRVPGYDVVYRNEVFPSRTLSNTNTGLRLSTLRNGWDASVFAYSSMDNAATFYREALAVPGIPIYEARHDRINQFGGTLSKDFGLAVLKAETVYTRGRQFSVARLSDSNGVVPQNTLDWAAGLDFSLPADTRLNMQFFQRVFFSHDPDLLSDRREDGYSVLVNHKLNDQFEVQALWIASLNRRDWLFRPRIVWGFERNWRLTLGADVFKGPALGVFGRYDGRDRVYSEVRYSF